MKKERIHGGATLWARQTLESEIFYYKPDKWFKIWFYLVNKVNHTESKLFKRGSGLITYKDIMDATKATKKQVESCIKWLEKETMLESIRTTRGRIRFIVNYDKFQSIESYRTTKKETVEESKRRLGGDLEGVSINNNDNNDNNEKNEKNILQSNDCGNEINSLFNLFYEINPNLNYGNKTQRKALEECIKKFGYENTKSMIEKTLSIQGEKYAPVVTTPIQFKEKLAQIKIYIEKEKSNKVTIGII